MSSNIEIVPITTPVQHAEGPFYDSKNSILYYVDTFTATAIKHDFQSNKSTSYKIEGRNSIGVIIPIAGDNDDFIVGADRFIYRLNWTDEQNEDDLEELLMVEPEKPQNQFNDGKVDRNGRLWLGTLTRKDDLSVKPDGGTLYMIKGEDLQNYEERVHNTSISNGLVWSRDGTDFYFIDSEPRLVFGYDYDEQTGAISGERIAYDINSDPYLDGIPDGMEIDTDDNLWIALFGGRSIINVDPKKSALIRVVDMPTTYVTSVCFGGPNFDILFVTTSKLRLNESQEQEEPTAGSVFAIHNLGVRGFPCNKFLLSHPEPEEEEEEEDGDHGDDD